MTYPLVSIIIPTYNRIDLIGETLDSVLAQTYENWECIVVDDGSTDGTETLLNRYVERDSNFQYFHRPNDRPKGANACRNYGLEKSRGEFIVFFDSDDIMSPSCLKGRVNLFLRNMEKDMVVFSMGTFNAKEGKKTNSDIWDSYIILEKIIENFVFKSKTPWQIGAPIIKADVIRNKIHFNEKISNYQDDEFFIRMLSFLKPNLLFSEQTDYFYRLDAWGKYNDIKSHQNIINSWPEYYKTIFTVLNIYQKNQLRDKLIFKFYDQVFGYYRKGMKLDSIEKVITLFDNELSLNLPQKLMFKIIILLNSSYFDKKGYYFLSKRMKRYMMKNR